VTLHATWCTDQCDHGGHDQSGYDARLESAAAILPMSTCPISYGVFLPPPPVASHAHTHTIISLPRLAHRISQPAFHLPLTYVQMYIYFQGQITRIKSRILYVISHFISFHLIYHLISSHLPSHSISFNIPSHVTSYTLNTRHHFPPPLSLPLPQYTTSNISSLIPYEGTRFQQNKPTRQTATHCNTVQHTATHCNTLQHIATFCNTRFQHDKPTRHTATHCNTLQHTATHGNTLQHTATRDSSTINRQNYFMYDPYLLQPYPCTSSNLSCDNIPHPMSPTIEII